MGRNDPSPQLTSPEGLSLWNVSACSCVPEGPWGPWGAVLVMLVVLEVLVVEASTRPAVSG